jgi:putative DNA primase/helicase
MIALMRDVRTGQPVGIHRTALNDEGTGKRVMPSGASAKKMLGQAQGAAILLQPASSTLGIAEGIETAISASQMFDVPVWAVMSAGGIRSFPFLHGLKDLTIFADQDEVGLKAAQTCALRHAKAGTHVEIRYPPAVRSDWNSYHLTEGA